MSFFDFPQTDLDSQPEDVTEYTWGEESYDGLGDALQEGRDELNDETFGDMGAIGKISSPIICESFDPTSESCTWHNDNFDFSSPALPDDHRRPAEASSRSHRSPFQEQAPPAGVIHDQRVVEPPLERSARATPQSLEAIWDNKSPFSVLPRSNGAGRSALSGLTSSGSPSAGVFGSTISSTAAGQSHLHGHSTETGYILSSQEVEAEMGLAAQQNRLQGTTSRQQLHQQQLLQEMRLRQQQEEERYLMELAQQREHERRQLYEQERKKQQRRMLLEEEQRRMLMLEQERELECQHLLQLQEQQRLQRLIQQQQQQQQRTPPPRMLSVSQSPRFFEHQRQFLQLQQQQQRQQQQQEQLQMEELQRQLLNNLSLQQQANSDPRRRLAGPTDYEIQAAQLLHQQQLQQRRQRSQSPSVNQVSSPHDLAPQNIQLQQRLLSEMAQAEFMREIQATTPRQLEQQEALRAEAMKKILEAEKMEEKRRRKAAKIAHMSRYNDLMTQSDKDFITRIQVSQLVTQDPYADDFYAQVYGAILRSRMGLQSDERVLKFGSGGGVGLGLTSQKGYRRPSAIQRMEQQVERIVSNARKREEEKGLHSIHSLQGALGKTSGRSYKAAPRQLLQVDSTPGTSPVMSPAHAHISKASASQSSKEGGAAEAAKLGRAALGDAADSENLVRKEPLSHREVLTIVENLYDLILNVEQVKRDQPLPEEEEVKHDEWKKEYDALMDKVWEELRVLVPLETSNPHPFISILGPSKGKKILPRLTRHLSSQRMLTLLTLLVACFGQLDVVRNASLLDSVEDGPKRAEAERQTNAFLASVMQSILPIVAKSNLRLITGLLGLLLDRSNITAVARTKPGLALLTLFLSRVEVIKQSIASGTQDIAEVPTTEEAQQWSNMFNHLFDLLAPSMLILFPSSRIVLPASQGQQQQPSLYDNADQHVWQFLAAFALHCALEQHQVLVTSLREKILDNLLAVSRGWFTTEEERNTKLGNVNLFLNALGLDSSQIAL
ncbi:DNA topoisomerase 2-associated protein pat1 [Leucoagaricus sp. SymC.cos]|nr:DNA topoisomerase 2-associated protein pat1 [Leucoagaricus sp. SymC.cos]